MRVPWQGPLSAGLGPCQPPRSLPHSSATFLKSGFRETIMQSLFKGAAAQPGAKAAGGPAAVKDVTTATFMADVIDASYEHAVVVDFWAPWCGPCKQLGPVIEKAVAETNGAVRMVKINIDQNQDLAMQMRIQSIPAVYAFKDGRPVDAFVG